MIAGDPVVDISVILFDGAFHDIDSSPLIFETAARMAMRQVLDMGELVILEPVMRLDVVTPADYAELIAADLRARRGRIERLNWMKTLPSSTPSPRWQTCSATATSSMPGPMDGQATAGASTIMTGFRPSIPNHHSGRRQRCAYSDAKDAARPTLIERDV